MEGLSGVQWYEWIESTINKEVLTKIIKDKKPQAGKGDAKKPAAKTAQPLTEEQEQKKKAAKEQLLKMQTAAKNEAKARLLAQQKAATVPQ